MIKKDYYEVLSISKDADGIVIKKAYRQMAMKYHPDRNQGDIEAEERFKEASEAYEVLSDPQKRNIYDQYGHQGLEGTGFSGFGGMDDIFSSFGDIFEEFFGGMGSSGFGFGRRSGTRARKGRDLARNLTVSFEEAVFGTKKEITIEREGLCKECDGQGVEKGTSRESCGYCNGTGKISHRQGFFMIQSSCAQCGGTGSIITNPCKKCRGKGRKYEEKKLSVKVPEGVDNGMHLILRGEGEAGYNSGPPGDAYVNISIMPHEFFQRHGNDIYYKLDITFPEAALGVEVKVPTMYGDEKIKVPSGTQMGDKLQLKGKGVKDVHSGKKGSQIVVVDIKTPTKLSKKQKKLLEDFLKETK